jgi:hypothetical protein
MDAEHANAGLCLPYDTLLDILRRLPVRALAMSSCVCREWRDIVDAQTLLFPREFAGVFAGYKGYDPGFALFGPPSSRDAANVPVYRRLSWDHWNYSVKQHCNGLLLLTDYMFVPYRNPYVCNPATGRYARLPCPSPPTPWWCSVEGVFLAFDPAVSRHYEVFFFPTEKKEHQEEQHESAYTKRPEEKVFHIFVYSSRTCEWESREFTPECSATGHLYDVVTTPRAKDERTWWSAEYWHGSLYVHCHSNVLMILRCPQGKYDMVQLPGHADNPETLYQGDLPRSYLASHDRGIRYATIDKFHLEVWELEESTDGQLGWTRAHKVDLKEYGRPLGTQQPCIEWTVLESSNNLTSLFEDYIEDSNDDCNDEEVEQHYGSDVTKGEGQEEQHTYDDGNVDGCNDVCNSDLHNFIVFDKTIIEDDDDSWWIYSIVGFHPYKDVLLLKFIDNVVAYHLHTSRMQYLGHIYPRKHDQEVRNVYVAFPYRPCYIDALPSRKMPRSS